MTTASSPTTKWLWPHETPKSRPFEDDSDCEHSDVIEDNWPKIKVWALVGKLRERCRLYEKAAECSLKVARWYVPEEVDLFACVLCGGITEDIHALIDDGGIRCETCDDIICDRCSYEKKKIFEDKEEFCQRCHERILCSCKTICAECRGDNRQPSPPRKKKKTKSVK